MEGQRHIPRGAMSLTQQSESLLSVGLLGILVVLLVPLPTALLDILLAINLAFTILLLLVTTNVKQPLEISVFPSLLLLMTLYRLSLNVATTRLILLHGDAGRIVSTFGGFVVGGNLVVGLVIFSILIIIQFIVITKGAGRVSEVAARFTLDALPGKQMAIDAELGAGTIDEATAKSRRKDLSMEAEFYGAMDGASKFVRGDAIAGVAITAVNLVGGVILGITRGLSFPEAFQQYSVLSIGDGLVSQIPALITATASGILVTKATSEITLATEIGSQMLSNRKPLLIGAAILVIVALTPGLPKMPFLALAAGLFLIYQRTPIGGDSDTTQHDNVGKSAEAENTTVEPLDTFVQTDRVRVEIGVRLIPLVDGKRQRSLADRISTLRADLTHKYGFWIPRVRVRDSLELAPDEYRIVICGHCAARGVLRVDKLMAINPGDTHGDIEGESTRDPAFDLPAKWISEDMRQRAELKGFTVVDPITVLITHLGELLRRYAPDLLSREDLKRLLDKVRETSPSVVDELKTEVIRMGELHQVLILLLQERIPLTNLTRILEIITQLVHSTKQPQDIAERIREHIGRDMLDRLRDEQGRLAAIVLDPRLELKFREAVTDGKLVLPPTVLERLVSTLGSAWHKHLVDNRELTLLCDMKLRRPLRQAIERSLADLTVTAYNEVPSDFQIAISSMVKLDDIYENESSSVTGESGRVPSRPYYSSPATAA
jgi:flagellar biosynthesis protein FlhA